MILRRDLEGIYLIEFENPLSDKWALDASDVLDLIPAKEKDNKFSLVYLVIFFLIFQKKI